MRVSVDNTFLHRAGSGCQLTIVSRTMQEAVVA